MKSESLELRTNSHVFHGILVSPLEPRSLNVILAHGAGGNMHQPFMRFFHEGIANAGYPSLKFNFPYSDAGKKAPDPQPVLTASYSAAIRAVSGDRIVIGGKSMGGRMGSYVAGEDRVAGLLFLGYPLHPPGKTDQLRDEHLYKINKPMLFISGTRDPFARLDVLQKTVKKIGKHARLHLIDDGGHSFEVPKKSGRNQNAIYQGALEQIVKWLESVRAGG